MNKSFMFLLLLAGFSPIFSASYTPKDSSVADAVQEFSDKWAPKWAVYKNKKELDKFKNDLTNNINKRVAEFKKTGSITVPAAKVDAPSSFPAWGDFVNAQNQLVNYVAAKIASREKSQVLSKPTTVTNFPVQETTLKPKAVTNFPVQEPS